MNHQRVPRPLLVMAAVLLVCVIKSQQMRWPSSFDQDRVSAIRLPEELAERKKETDIRIVVYTSDKAWADSDDPVHINIIGTAEATDNLSLNNPGDEFPRAGVDIFRHTTFAIGVPYEIEVWGGENGDSWHLNKIDVELDSKRYLYEATVFVCGEGDNCWLTTTAKTKLTLKKPKTMMKRKWKVTYYTAKSGGAKTRDAAWIQFHGNNGSSDFLALNKQGVYIANKANIIHEVGAPDYIGDPHSITIMASRRGDGLKLLRVDAETFINYTRWVYTFDCGGVWFDTGETSETKRTFNLTKKESRFP